MPTVHTLAVHRCEEIFQFVAQKFWREIFQIDYVLCEASGRRDTWEAKSHASFTQHLYSGVSVIFLLVLCQHCVCLTSHIMNGVT